MNAKNGLPPPTGPQASSKTGVPFSMPVVECQLCQVAMPRMQFQASIKCHGEVVHTMACSEIPAIVFQCWSFSVWAAMLIEYVLLIRGCIENGHSHVKWPFSKIEVNLTSIFFGYQPLCGHSHVRLAKGIGMHLSQQAPSWLAYFNLSAHEVCGCPVLQLFVLNRCSSSFFDMVYQPLDRCNSQ